MVKVAGSLQQSTEVMKTMQQLVKLPEIQKEMMEGTMEGLTESEDLEEEVNTEVDKILFELTAGKLGEAPAALKDTLPAPAASVASPAVREEAESEEEDMEEMQNRLEALRS